MFSVVIPAHNSSAFLTEALASVRQQTFQDVEVMVVDDGSSDDTFSLALAVMAALKLKGSVLKRPPDRPKGPGTCRNYGVEMAGGEFVAFLDSDDIWLPGHLEQAQRRFAEYGNDMVAYCAMGERFNDLRVAGCMPENGFPFHGLQDCRQQLLDGMFVPTQTLCVRRDFLIRGGGFHEKLRCYEDWWFLLQLSQRGKIFFSPDCECRIRMRSGSLSRSQNGSDQNFRMSPAMYRDQLRLYRMAQASNLFKPDELFRLRETVVRFHTRQLADLMCAGYWTDVRYILSAMASAGVQSLPEYIIVGTRVLSNVGKRAVAKAKMRFVG